MYAVNPFLFKLKTSTVYTVNPRIYIRGGHFILYNNNLELLHYLDFEIQAYPCNTADNKLI